MLWYFVVLGIVLAPVFAVLRLTHVVDWSWWAIWSPLYVPLGLIALAKLMAWGCGALARVLETPEERANRELRESLSRMATILERRR